MLIPIYTILSLFLLSVMSKIIKRTNIINSESQSNHLPSMTTLAGGCFWCIEGAFSQVQGVHSTTSGYMGGHTKNPSYEDICTGQSGHAEVVQLVFDSAIISYQQILEIFFTLHDPTQLNRQGNDIGSQYRSAIFYHDENQKKIALNMIESMTKSKIFDQDIVTQLYPVDVFYSGEAYHQNYINNNAESPYCQAVISPKLDKFRKTFIDKLK